MEASSPEAAPPAPHLDPHTDQPTSNGHALHHSQDQQASDQQHLLHQEPNLPVPPESPFAMGTHQPPNTSSHAGSPAWSIPPAHHQPTLSSSAPTDSHSYMHQWAAKRSRPSQDHPQEPHQQPRASPPDEAEQNGDGEAGQGAHPPQAQAPPLSALHGGRSRSRANLASESRQHIRWNDSRESLAWSSQEDLTQLLPDRASTDGVERPPQEGFSGWQDVHLLAPFASFASQHQRACINSLFATAVC